MRLKRLRRKWNWLTKSATRSFADYKNCKYTLGLNGGGADIGYWVNKYCCHYSDLRSFWDHFDWNCTISRVKLTVEILYSHNQSRDQTGYKYPTLNLRNHWFSTSIACLFGILLVTYLNQFTSMLLFLHGKKYFKSNFLFTLASIRQNNSKTFLLCKTPDPQLFPHHLCWQLRTRDKSLTLGNPTTLKQYP